MQLSSKSQRALERLGVLAAFARGEQLVVTGRSYAPRRAPGGTMRLAFVYDDAGRLCVGYATYEGSAWRLAESEPFSLRALGYYERRLKRIGEVVDDDDRRAQR